MAPHRSETSPDEPVPGGARYDRDFLDNTARIPALDDATRIALDKGVEAWRSLRIQGEFVNSYDQLADLGPAVAVFGSSRLTESTPAYARARRLGSHLSEAGFAVVTGGGPGLMEATNHGAADAGGRSVGLGIKLPFEDGFNDHVDLAVPFHYFFTRKVSFVKYTSGAIFCEGGLGTLDEFFEVMTLLQTGKTEDYPVALLGVDFWTPLLDWLRGTLLEQGTISEEDLRRPLLTDDPGLAVAHMSR